MEKKAMFVGVVFQVLSFCSLADYKWSVNADAHETARLLFCLLMVMAFVFYGLAFVLAPLTTSKGN